MSKAEELLKTTASSPTRSAGTGVGEEHIVIGRDRIIVIPDSIQKIGVQFDHNIETVTFDCPRYWDEHDMSKMKIYVNYMRSDGHIGMHLCGNVVAEEEIMHFDWTISGDVTAVEGYLSFLVCVKKTDAEGNEAQHWNSMLNKELYIAEGLECQENILSHYPDIITQLLTRMDDVEIEQQRWEKATEEDIVAWKNTAKDEIEAWEEAKYKELDDRMKVAEGNTTPDEIRERVHEAIASDETVHQILEDTTDNYIQTNVIIAETVEKTNEAISIAKGANLSVSYASYEEMVSVVNTLDKEKFNPGQNIYIGAVNIPDLFVYGVAETPVEYTYVDDKAIIDEMTDNVFFQVGYYQIAQLETQSVVIRDVIIPLFAEDWVRDGLDYVQTVEVEGLAESNNPVIMLYSVADKYTYAELEAYSCISDVNVTQGAITFIASEKPVTSITVIAKSVTAAEGTEVAINAFLEKVDNLTDIVVPLMLTNWVAEGDSFVQNIPVEGLVTSNAPMIVLSSANEIATDNENYAYNCLSDVVVTEGNLKFIASEKPPISFTVIVKGVFASENNVAADITALVARVSELESGLQAQDISYKLSITSDSFDIQEKLLIKSGNMLFITIGARAKQLLEYGKHYNIGYAIDGYNTFGGIAHSFTEENEASGANSFSTSIAISNTRLSVSPNMNIESSYVVYIVGVIMGYAI